MLFLKKHNATPPSTSHPQPTNRICAASPSLTRHQPLARRLALLSAGLLALSLLQSCILPEQNGTGAHRTSPSSPSGPDIALTLPDNYNRPAANARIINMPGSRWVPVGWADLPGWEDDRISEAWQAWIWSCSQPSATWAVACAQIMRLTDASENTKRQWMYDHLQPYRVETTNGNPAGLLTAYYEPIFRANRNPVGDFVYPLYTPPADLHPTRPYWSRKDIETNPRAQQALQNKAFAYMDNPLDVLILHIQGSGQLILTEPDGTTHRVRAAYAANNNQRYASVGRYLLDRKLITDATWPGIRSWLEANPSRVNEVLWSNPRYIFFNEIPLEDPSLGPIGAQGVPLTSGRSIAVDKRSIPYGTPVWIATQDPTGITQPIKRLVLAQDTGSAINGAVRADYFWGQGPQAGEEAGRTKQTLYMWAFLPKPE